MKILMTTDAVGGVWTYALELCAELARRDVEVVLAVMGPRASRAQLESVSRIPGLRLHCSELKLEWMSAPWSDVERAGEWLQDLAGREAVDLIHLNGYVHAALPWRKPVVVVAHSCVCSWWQAVHGEAPPEEWDAYRRRVAAGLRAADHVVAPTFAFLKEVNRWHRPAAPSSVIHNARSPAAFACEADRDREPLIFACGRLWDEAKNMHVLDAAACDLPWPTYVAGDATGPDGAQFSSRLLKNAFQQPARPGHGWPGPSRIEFGMHSQVLDFGSAAKTTPSVFHKIWASDVEKSMEELFQRPTGASVKCLGALSQDDVASWLRRAAIYVHPAKYEPFGLSVLEAAMAGCALVLSDLPGLRELWDGAALFVRVQTGNAVDRCAALRSALQRLIAEPALRQQLSQASMLRARRFTPEAMGREYLEIYSELCPEHSCA